MIDADVLARGVSAALWIWVLCRYILDVIPTPTTTGNRIVQAGLGFLFGLIAFGAVRSIWVALEPSWLTYAFPATAAVMLVGQHWDHIAPRLPRRRPRRPLT